MLKHYRIHISHLSVIGAAKVSHFEILCRVHGFEPTVGLFCCFYVNSKNKGWISFSKRQGTDAVCYTKPLDSLKGWNNHFFWIDAFACHALFPWHTGKSVSRDVIPKSFEFSPEHYATLIAYSAPFHKYPKPFLCLVGMSQMDLLSFIRTADPTKVRIDERQRVKDEPKLLETTVGRVVSLLPVAPNRSSGELEANVEKLFDEGEWGGIMPTLLFVSSSVSSTPKREDGGHTELLAWANLHAIGAPQRFVIFSDSFDHSSVNIAEAEVDYVVRTSMPIITSATTTTPTVDPAAIAKEKLVGSYVFGADSPSAGESHSISGGFSDDSGSDFLVSGIRTVIDPDSNLQKVYVPPKFLPSSMLERPAKFLLARRIKRYIDTKPNHKLIDYCLKNPLYKYTWADKAVPVFEGSSETTTERYMETYKNVSQDIRDQLNAKAEVV
nr:hypothetical protein [Tanacetum cinerariifolium]